MVRYIWVNNAICDVMVNIRKYIIYEGLAGDSSRFIDVRIKRIWLQNIDKSWAVLLSGTQ